MTIREIDHTSRNMETGIPEKPYQEKSPDFMQMMTIVSVVAFVIGFAAGVLMMIIMG